MIFREATTDDLSRLLELEQGVIAAERPLNASLKSSDTYYYDLPGMIADPDTHLIVIEVGEALIGSGYSQIRDSKDCFVHDQHAYIGFMFVSPDYRGQKLAQRILDQLIEWSESKGVSDFYLDVYAQNEAAIRSYSKAGFEPCSVAMKLCR